MKKYSYYPEEMGAVPFSVYDAEDVEAALAERDRRIADLTAENESLREALETIAAIEDCGCGVPCDCHSWYAFVRLAQDAIGKEGK